MTRRAWWGWLLCCALTSPAAAQSIHGDRLVLNTGPCTLRSGSGAPEGAVIGAVCDTYYQTDSPYDLWRKTSGAGNTGWERVTIIRTATAGQVLRSAANAVPAWSTATYPATAATAGAYLRADGTNWITSTLVLPNAATQGDLLTATGANTLGSVAAVAVGQVLASAGAGTVPAYTASPSLTSIGGTTNLELNPTGDLIADPSGNDVLPEVNYDINLGALSKKYLTLHAAELWVETLVAQNTIATIGGRVLVGPTTVFTSDLAATAGDSGVTSGMLGYAGIAVHATWPGCAVDGNYTGCWHTDSAAAGSYIQIDFGAGNEKAIGKGGIQAAGVSAAVWRIEYYSGGSWYPVCTMASLTAGWTTCHSAGTVSPYRYWRFYLTNTPGGGSWQHELQLWITTPIYTKHNEMAIGDVAYAEANGAVEFFYVQEGPYGAGPYTYYVARDLDGTGRNDWYAGDASFNTGAAGDGFMDLYSVHGVKSASEYGPSIVGNVRTSATYNAWSPRWAIGNLNGVFGYSSTTWGAAFGDHATANLTIDATNGLRIRDGSTNLLQADISGNLKIGDPSGNRVTWDGTDLIVVSDTVSILTTGIWIDPDTTASGPSPSDSHGYNFTSAAGVSYFGTYGGRYTGGGGIGSYQDVMIFSYLGEADTDGTQATVTLQANSEDDEWAYISVIAEDSGSRSGIHFLATSNTPGFRFGGGDFSIGTGLNDVDKKFTVTTTGQVWAASSLTTESNIIIDSAAGAVLQIDSGSTSYYAQVNFYRAGTWKWQQYVATGATGEMVFYNTPDGAVLTLGGTTWKTYMMGAAYVTGMLAIPAGYGFYLDGGTHSYIAETSDNVVRLYSGGAMAIEANGSVIGVGGSVNGNVRENLLCVSSQYCHYDWTSDGKTANFYTADSGGGYLRAAAWTYGSDRSLKRNIQYGMDAGLTAADGLAKILALRPARFDYVDGGPVNQLGFVAQDVQPVIPEAVVVALPETGTLGLKTDFILPYAVLAIQQHETRIAALEAEIVRLKGDGRNKVDVPFDPTETAPVEWREVVLTYDGDVVVDPLICETTEGNVIVTGPCGQERYLVIH